MTSILLAPLCKYCGMVSLIASCSRNDICGNAFMTANLLPNPYIRLHGSNCRFYMIRWVMRYTENETYNRVSCGLFSPSPKLHSIIQAIWLIGGQ